MREKLIDVFCAVLGADPDYRNEEAIQFVDELIENGVTVQETGYWEWDTEDIYKCSHCGDKVHVKEVMGQPDWGFCPACGARMLPEPPKGE